MRETAREYRVTFYTHVLRSDTFHLVSREFCADSDGKAAHRAKAILDGNNHVSFKRIDVREKTTQLDHLIKL